MMRSSLKFFLLIFLLCCFNLIASEKQNPNFKKEVRLTNSFLEKKKKKSNIIYVFLFHLENLEGVSQKNYILEKYKNGESLLIRTKLFIDNNKKVWYEMNGVKLPLDYFNELEFSNPYDGEFFELVLLDENNNRLSSTKIAPKPIEIKFKDGATLKLEMTSFPHFALYNLNGKGFKPNEQCQMSSQSENEITPLTPYKSDAEGGIIGTIAPEVIGKYCGHASITLVREDGEKGVLKYTWGKPSDSDPK